MDLTLTSSMTSTVTGPENGYAGQHEEDGFFTCAVSVQHKKHDTETGSNYSSEEAGRRVVWPANQTKLVKQSVDAAKTFHNTFKQAVDGADNSHKWIHKATEDEAIKHGFNRVSRSRSRSKNIMERARSFERAAADTRANSRPVSRSGSFRNRSSSGNRNTMEEQWSNQMERPASRTDVDSRRFGEIGRVNTLDWEERIHGSTENLPARTPPPRRREMNLARNVQEEEDRMVSAMTPEPPPPPTRAAQIPRDEAHSFPPPPPKLSEESVNRLTEENKEKIVKEWVESTSHSTDNIHTDLEKFAYDIAESVVLSMEQKNETKEAWSQQTGSQFAAADQAGNQSSGVYHASPAFVQDQHKRVGMTFQQEERRRQELRKKEEAQQEERRRLAVEAEEQERRRLEAKEQERRRLEAEEQEKRRLEAEERRQQEEIMRRKEEERRQQEMRRREEEERIRIEQERIRIEKERIRVEQQQRAAAEEQERLRQEELKRQEIQRYEKLRQEEEAMRLEEMRLEQEMRRKYEIQQQQILEQKRQEEQLAHQMENEQQQKDQESVQVRGHIPKLSKTRSFDHSQDRNADLVKGGDHLGKVRTGQVNEKRNFWIRSTSADRSNSQTLSPAPRRRKIDGWNKQKENEDPDSRPGSSLGQARIGSVKNLSSGFISKSKSSTAVMQEETSRGRPRQKKVQEGSWTKEKYDQHTNQSFLKAQEVKTNKVNETITTWGKQEQCTSGRSTPVPSRNIGQVFSENRLAKAECEKSANSWRTKTPEPSVKLVNVSVEKSVGSNQNIHISENAHAQMASYLQDSSTASAFNKGSQPPPAPERNQSIGGKLPDSKPECEPTSSTAGPKSCTETRSYFSEASERTCSINQDSQCTKYPNISNPVSSQDKIQDNLQPSPSHQSINSVISNCSSGALPLPVKNSWFDEMDTTSAASSSCTNIPEGVMSPTGTGRTPVPVVAHWFTHSDLGQASDHILIDSSRSKNSSRMESSLSEQQQVPPANQSSQKGSAFSKFPSTKEPSMPKKLNVTESSPSTKRINTLSSHAEKSVSSSSNKVMSSFSINKSESSQSKSEISSKRDVQIDADIHSVSLATSSLSGNKEVSNMAENTHPEQTLPNKMASFSARITKQTEISEENFQKDQSKIKMPELKKSLADDIDTRSVKSDSTVIEKKTEATDTTDAPTDTTVDSSSCIITVPQSPSEIRKRFQRTSSFEKNYQKSADLELSKEFREGIKGKVRESKASFMKSSSSDKLAQAREMREIELNALKLRRSDSGQLDESLQDRTEAMRQAKMRELENVKRSRSRSKVREEDCLTESSYAKEKSVRDSELASLSSRKIDVEDALLFSPTELREIQLREERERELAALCARRTLAESEEVRADSAAWEDSDQVDPYTVQEPGEPDEAGGRVRETTALWDRREKSGSRERSVSTPTRRIGSMFRRDPDYWAAEDEDLPAPPPEEILNPAPPPRQSSRGKVEEYRHWSGGWRGSNPASHHKLH